MPRWKRKTVLFCIAAMALTIAGIFITGCGTLRMSFVDFPVTTLNTKAPIGTWEKSDGQGATPVYQGLATN